MWVPSSPCLACEMKILSLSDMDPPAFVHYSGIGIQRGRDVSRIVLVVRVERTGCSVVELSV